MSTPNPTHIIAELLSVLDEHIYPDTFAEHVVSKLTDAGYSIVPSARVIHNEDEFHELPVGTWLRDSVGWVCQIGDAAESDPDWMAYPATAIWTPAAAEGEKP